MNEPMPVEVVSTMCNLCLQLPLATAGTPPHEELCFESRLSDSAYSKEQVYRCAVCNTCWLRRTDRWGGDAGFRLAP